MNGRQNSFGLGGWLVILTLVGVVTWIIFNRPEEHVSKTIPPLIHGTWRNVSHSGATPLLILADEIYDGDIFYPHRVVTTLTEQTMIKVVASNHEGTYRVFNFSIKGEELIHAWVTASTGTDDEMAMIYNAYYALIRPKTNQWGDREAAP